MNYINNVRESFKGVVKIVSIAVVSIFSLIGALSVAVMVFGPGERFVHVPLGRMVSPTGKWVIDVSDVRWERGLFPISTIATHVDLRVAGGSGKPVRLLDSFTDLNDELRPEVMWVGDGRICLVTPQIDGMSFRSGVIDGVHVDVHVLRWNQTGQPQKIDLKAMCGT